MPATLDQAFQSPFHRLNGAPAASSGTDSIRNPDYYAFQNNYRVKSAMDIESEADDLKHVYNTLPTLRTTGQDPTMTTGSSTTDHDCTLLIAKILACPRCRNKVKELLKSDERETETHNGQEQNKQTGGGLNLNDLDLKSILVNIILSVLLVMLVDFVLRS